jgi:hypothetical protein
MISSMISSLNTCLRIGEDAIWVMPQTLFYGMFRTGILCHRVDLKILSNTCDQRSALPKATFSVYYNSESLVDAREPYICGPACIGSIIISYRADTRAMSSEILVRVRSSLETTLVLAISTSMWIIHRLH